MSWTIAFIFVLLWVLGLVSSYTMGGFIHLLLTLAAALLTVRIVERPVREVWGQRNAGRM